MITHIYFDWSGTLAKRDSKATFVYGNTVAEKCATLLPGVRRMLSNLIRRGFTLGLISNTSKPADLFLKSLEECDMRKYFRGAILMSSQGGLQKKPAPCMFRRALSIDRISPDQALMVGNDYKKDILGARRLGISAIQIQNGRIV